MSITQDSIKVVINNRNRLTSTKKMVEQLLLLNPEHYAYKDRVLEDQARCWLEEAEDGVYWADTDTTFALQRNTGGNMYESLRIARRGFKSRHTPFYLDLNGLPAEEKYVLQHHDFRFHTSYTRIHANKIKP